MSKDFSNIVPGEWLFRDRNNSCYHIGYYIGNGRVIESTSDGLNKTQVSTIDSNGHSNLRGSSWTWTSHGKVPWIDYSGSPSQTSTGLSISGQSAPSGTLPLGKGFSLTGIITSSSNITYVCGYVVTTAGEEKLVYRGYPNSKSYNIKTGRLDAGIAFGSLPEGSYVYVVYAEDASGDKKDLVRSEFVMGNPTAILDVNGLLDGEEHGNLENYGTFDVKIKRHGEDWFQWTDLNDFYESLPAGTQYSIEDIKQLNYHSYLGVCGNTSGVTISDDHRTITGTLNSNQNIMLDFRTNDDVGDQFYATLTNKNGWRLQGQGDFNVVGLASSETIEQVWYFERLINNYYKITSPRDGRALEVNGGYGTVGANVGTGGYWEDAAQKWAIFEENGYVMLSPMCSTCVLDSGEYNEITKAYNVYMQRDYWNEFQTFKIEKTNHPQLTIIYNSNGATNIKKEGQVISEETLTNLPQIKHYSENMSDGLWDGDNSGWLYLERTGYEMATKSWNTKADGTGISVNWYQSFDTANDLAKVLGVDLSTGSKTVTVYMEWQKLTPDFVLPSMLTSIEEEAFAGGAFRFVKLPENAVSIGWHAFAECPNLAYIYIPATVTEIDAQAFGSETNLTIIGASGSVAESFAIEHGFTFMVG